MQLSASQSSKTTPHRLFEREEHTGHTELVGEVFEDQRWRASSKLAYMLSDCVPKKPLEGGHHEDGGPAPEPQDRIL